MRRALLILALATLATAALFLAVPGIDRAVEAAVLLGPGGRFRLDGVGWGARINETVPWLMTALGLAFGLLGLSALGGRPVGGIGIRQIVYVAAVCVIGPWLLVNELLKDNVGRARPRDVLASPEPSPFTPPFVFSKACPRNCSFPSGEASAGFAFVAVALVLPRRRRLAGLAGAVALGSFYGGIRMLQGAHYLSDVVFAGLLMALIAVGLHWLMFRRTASEPAGTTRDRAT